MTFSTHPTRPKRGGRGGPPSWFVFLLGVALVFSIYYLWVGLRDFVQTSGLGMEEATQRSEIINTATAEIIQQRARPTFTPHPSSTPIPECQDFVVSVPNAIVRELPSSSAAILTSYFEGTVVCVIGREPDGEWYLIDENPETRRVNPAYMHESVIEALNPTPTPSDTVTPLPTVTPMPSLSPTASPTASPTPTRDPSVSDTPTPTFTPSPSPVLQSA